MTQGRIGGLVPGLHRCRIGGMEAAVVTDGPLHLWKPARIFPGLAPRELESALAASFLPAGKVRAEQNCLLLDLGGRLALFDNGMGESKLFGKQAGRLMRSLAEAGLGAGDISAVVLSHLHPDHCWGTATEDGTPAFPNAEIFVARAEWEFWAADPPGDDLTLDGVRRRIRPLRDRITLFGDGEEFLPGVRAMPAPGHTPGHAAFLVGPAEAPDCVLGDVAFHAVSFAHPEAHSAYDHDGPAAARTRRRVLDMLAARRMRAIGYHQPWPGIGHVARDGSAFRWVPEPVELALAP